MSPPLDVMGPDGHPVPANLTPVDFDPFAAPPTGTLTPVDFDPFDVSQSWPHAIANAAAGAVVEGTGAAIAGAGRAADEGALNYLKERLAEVNAGTGHEETRARARAALEAKIAEAEQRKPGAVQRAGTALEQTAQQQFPVDPTKEGHVTNITRGVAGLVPVLGAAAVTAAVPEMLVPEATEAAAGASVFTSQAARSAAVKAATDAAKSFWGKVGGITGAAATIYPQSYESTYQEAKQKGATEEQAHAAASKDAAIQTALTSVPVGRLLEKVPEPLRDGFLKTLTNVGMHGIEFGSITAASKFADNYVAQQSFDPDRKLTDGVFDSTLEGTLTGMVVPATAAGAKALWREAKKAPPPPPPGSPPPPPPGSPPPPPPGSPPAAPPGAKPPRSVADIMAAESVDATAAKLIQEREVDALRAAGVPPPAEAPAPPPQKPKRAPKASAVTPTTPEAPADVKAQIEAVADPKNPKDTAFIAAGTPMPPDVPKGVIEVKKPEGTLLTTDPGKAHAFQETQALTDAHLANLLGYPETKEEAIASGAPAVVQAVDPAGHAVTEMLASPAGIPAAETVAEEHKPPGGEVRVVSPEQGQQERVEGRPAPEAENVEPPPVKPEPPPVKPPKASVKPKAQTVKPPEPEPVRISTTAAGHPLFEDANGVRSYVENGVRVSEPVEIRPVRDENGAIRYVPTVDPAKRSQEFLTAEERAPKTTEAPPTPPEPPAVKPPEPAPTTKRTQMDEDAFRGALRNTGSAQRDGVWRIIPTGDGYGVEHTKNGERRLIQDSEGRSAWSLEKARDEAFRQAFPERVKPPEVEPPKPTEAPAPASIYGANNKLVSQDRAAELRAKLKAKLGGQLNAGIDPETMAIGAELAVFHIEAGARAFMDFAHAIARDLETTVTHLRPFLRSWYNGARDMMEDHGIDVAGMDAPEAVKAHLNRIDQEATNATPPVGSGLDQPGGGEGTQGGVHPGQPEGNGNPDVLAPAPSEDVRGPDGTGVGGEAGVRPGHEAVPGNGALPESGNAANGRGGAGEEGVAADGGGERVPQAAPTRPNFHIDDPARLIGGTPKVRFNRNRAAIEAMNAIEAEQRAPTPEELETIAGYTGWGSFGQDLFQGKFDRPWPRPGWDAEAKWLREHLGRAAWEDAQRSIINAHYTDPPTVQAMWDMVQRMGFKGGRVLEPSMGIGNFFGLMPRDIMNNSTLTGIELDRVTGQMAKLLYPQAGIHIKGYQDSHTPDNFYDLVIGNWPFSATSPPDRRYDRLSPTLHDYFFLKALDQTRPGGLVIGITSAGTMDKSGRAARLEMAKKGELLAAFRLPTGAFEGYAGTSVVTDILVLRKRATAPANLLSEPWIEATPKQTPSGQPVRVNQYFQEHPENVLGVIDFGHGTTTGRPGMIVQRPNNFPERLAGLAAKLPTDGYQPTIRGGEPRFIANNTADRQNSITIGPDGKLYQVAGERLILLSDIPKALAASSPAKAKVLETQVRSLVDMRKAYGALIDAERDGAANTEDLRRAVAQQFDAFRKAHKNLTDAPGMKVLNRVNDPAYAALASLERPDGSPARLLSEPTMRSRKNIDQPSVADAYVIARNEQTVLDMDRVAELAKLPRDVVTIQLLDNGAILRTPGGKYEPKDQYLSGDVRRKLREAQEAKANGEDMDASIAELTKVLPATVPYYQIEAKLGAPWVSDAAYKTFIGDLLGLKANERDDINVRFAGSRWRVSLPDFMNNSPEALDIWGHPRRRFDKMIEDAMGNLSVRIMDPKDRDGGPYFNQAATDEVNAKIQGLRERFSDWAWQDAERKIVFEKAYNEVMNAIAKPHYDGSFMDMSGMSLRRGDDPFSLRRHQINAIWRGVIQGRGLFAHEVGTGKTLVLGGIAVEGRRYGVFCKPLIFAHNANSSSVAREIGEMYPGGRFLYVDNLKPDEIKTTLHRIASDDWDAVIMPHSLIDKMTLKRDTLRELAADQIAELEAEAIAAARDDGQPLTTQMMDDKKEMGKLRSPTAKQLVNQRNNIIANIEKQANRSSEEGAVPFEDLGIDSIIVDESHEFKKPPIATRMKLKGLNTQTSNRSIALNFLTGYVKKNNNGRGVYLFTGTPITNSLNEIFNMGRYFMDDKMALSGIRDWDAWFNTFASAVSDVELTAAGTYEPVTRLSSFNNVDELIRMMSEFTDVVQAKDMPEFVARTTPSGKTLASPDLTAEERAFLVDGRSEKPEGRPYKKIVTDVAEMSPDQKRILDHIRKLSQEFKEAGGKDRWDWMRSGDERSPVLLETGAANAGIDPRLYDPDAKDVPDSKINRVVRNVLKHYQEPNSGQVIFVDRGYNAVKSSEGRQDRFVLTRDIINKLVEGGIPRKEIAIVAGGLEPEQKKMLADKMNTGELRVVIGQSGTLGVGVNMQVNLRAMHHMDAPWRPGDLEQRNGRGERQGNKWNTVLEYRYVTEGIDGRRWQVLTLKDKFIKQFINAFNDESGKRIGSIEGDAADISDDEDILNTLSAAAGDPRIAIREKIKSDVERLQKRERMHVTGLEDARSRAAMLKRSISDFLGRASTYELSLQTWDDASKRAEDDAKAAGEKRRWYEATVDGKPARTGDQIQEGIDAQVKALAKGDKRTLATINGFDIEADWTGGRQEPIYRMLHDGDSLAVIQAPTMPRIIAEIRGIRDDANMYRLKVQDAKASIPRLEAAANEPFPQQAALERKRQQLAQIEDDLQANPIPPPGWLRHGAPIGSDIYVNGRALTVEGHRMDTDYTIVTNEGEVPYLDAKDANGQRIFDVHPPPAPGAAKVVPEWAAKVARERKAEIVWHDDKKGLALALGHEDDEPAYFGIKTKNGKTNVTSGDVDTMSREDFATFGRQDFTEFRAQKETAVRRAERDAQRAAAAGRIKSGKAVYEPRQFAGEPSVDEAKPRGYGGDLDLMLSRGNAAPRAPSPDALQALVDDARRIVGPHVRIEVYEGSGLLVKRNGQTELVDGMTLGRLIRVALNEGIGTTLDHEAIHALFNLGAFKPQEWAALTNAAERQNWIKRYGIDKTYSDMPHERQIEEAIAHRFADPSPRSPPVERAMRAVQAFMERVRNALAGRGFQTADDVFGRVRRGEMGAREPGSGAEQRGPRTVGESQARMEKWHEGEPQFAKLPASAKKPLPLKPDPAWKRAVDEIRTVLSPTSRGSDAKRQEYAHREFGARLAQASQIAAHRLEDARRLVSRYSPDEQDEQNHKLETGQSLGDPKLDAAAKALREAQAEWLQKLQSLGYLKDTIDNYMGHIYSNYREWKAGQIGTLTPAQVDARNRMLAAMKRPIRGPGEFLKQRTFDTLQDAMAAGLEPVTHNWIDMQLLKLRSMQRFYEGTQYAEKMKKTGLAFWVPVTATREAEASGFKKLNDEIFQPRIRSDAEYGVREVGNWMAPGPAADVFNNAMAPGLMSKWPTIYGGLRSTANALNGLQLGLSGFHATFEALDSIHSQTALGLRQIARGSVGKGIRTIAGAYAAPVTTWRAGSQFIRAYLNPDNASPEMRKIVDAAIKGGVRIGYDKFYRSTESGPFFHSLKDFANPQGAFREALAMVTPHPGEALPAQAWHILRGSFRVAGRLIDTSMEPLMGFVVPKLKAGVMANLARDFLEHNPTASEDEVAAAMTKAQDSVDNRMGQLVYDNLFWHKTLKDIAFLTTRSVGWNLGTLRELGGAVVDTAHQANRIAHFKAPELTDRMAYAIAMTVNTALIGSIMTYLATGQGPQSLMDLFYPPDGTTQPNGAKNRLSVPGYMKDVVDWTTAPLSTAGNKANPLISTAIELGSNKDYYGGIIYNSEKDNPFIAYADYLLNQTLPFSARATVRLKEQGASPLQQMLGFWGIQPAPQSIVNPAKGEMWNHRQMNIETRRREREQGRISLQ